MGHHRLIVALPQVLARRPDVRLRILGSGPLEGELRRLVNVLGLSEHVTIEAIPSSDRRQMAETLARASLVALLSEVRGPHRSP